MQSSANLLTISPVLSASRKLGIADRNGAVTHYQAAASKTGSLPERNYLLTQAARLSME